MARKHYLVFDFGASNGRALVGGFDGKKIELDLTYRFENGPVTAAGTTYWDILHLFSELKTGLLASLRKYPDIVSVGIDTWGCDFGLLDKNGKLISNPVTYRDKLRHERLPLLFNELSRRELFQLCSGSTNGIAGLYQLYSFHCDEATECAHGHRLLMMPDLLNYFLTGRAVNEYTNATTALLCDQFNKTWGKRILSRLGIPDRILGDLIMPGEAVGPIQKEVCEELCVPSIEVIATVSHDTASAVTGIPVTDPSRHWAFISMGTWSIAGVETTQPVVSDAAFELDYGNNAIADGRNMLVNYITGLWTIQQCRKKWTSCGARELSWSEIVQLSEAAGPATAFIDVDDPLFGAPQADMPSVIVSYCRNNGQTISQDVGAVARTIYESLVLKYRHKLEALGRMTGRKLDLLHLVGGGIQNRTLCQWTADALGVPVIAGMAEATSVGNFLMQLKHDGEIADLAQGRDISVRSSVVTRYEPRDRSHWDEAYSRFNTMLELANGDRARVSQSQRI